MKKRLINCLANLLCIIMTILLFSLIVYIVRECTGNQEQKEWNLFKIENACVKVGETAETEYRKGQNVWACKNDQTYYNFHN